MSKKDEMLSLQQKLEQAVIFDKANNAQALMEEFERKTRAVAKEPFRRTPGFPLQADGNL